MTLQLTALESLGLCAAEAPGPAGGLQHLPQLTKLTITTSKASGPESFWELSTLRMLSLRKSYVHGPGNSFDSSSSPILMLCLDHCTLPRAGFPSALCMQPLLSCLRLTSCKLGEHPNPEPLPYLLTCLWSLFDLDLGDNGLRQVPAVVPRLMQLRRLNLNENVLDSLPRSMAALMQLYILELSGNKFQEWPSVLYDLEHVMVLDLSNTPLRTTHLDIQELEYWQCLYHSFSGESWVFLGQDKPWELEDGEEGKKEWTSKEVMAAMEFAKAFPNCALHLGEEEGDRMAIITEQWMRY